MKLQLPNDEKLTNAEINHIYNNGLNNDLAENTDVFSKNNLKAYYKMEGTGNTLIDSSGNDEDGTIYGATREKIAGQDMRSMVHYHMVDQ